MALPFLSSGLQRGLQKLYDAWGRWADRGSSYLSAVRHYPPQDNPDTTTDSERHHHSLNPFTKAGLLYRDVGNLFVSAGGMSPDENGASYPGQLLYTQDGGDPEILEALAKQYDEGFQASTQKHIPGGFANILRKLDNARKTRGFCIAENLFVRGDLGNFNDFVWVDTIFSRDPEPYVFDYEGKPGIYYQGQTHSIPKRMRDQKFMSFSYDPIFDNPYGTSINLPLKPYLETFNKVFGYRRHALEKAGLGFIIAHYPDRFAGVDSRAVSWRTELQEQLKNLVSGAYGTIHEAVNLESLKLDSDAQAFVTWHMDFVQAVSILYTGSATALIEGRFGSRAMAEATVVREKSKREQLDAMEVSAFWTYKFNRIWCDLNFPPERIKGIYPTLQLIAPELILPTTPESQEQINVQTEEPARVNEAEKPSERGDIEEPEPQELQAAELQEEAPAWTPPPAVPGGYKDFPNEDPLPDDYVSALDAAEAYLQAMPVKSYPEVDPDDAATTFTVKRLRTYSNDQKLLTRLKEAIIPTLGAENEMAAWVDYWRSAVQIFKEFGVDRPSSNLRDDLKISFRQARQNALNEGFYQMALSDPGVVGLRIKNIETPGVQHHFRHTLWDNIALPKEHPELQLGGRLRIPMDFGCLCRYEKVTSLADLTPEADWPSLYPGESYRLYARPRTDT